MRSFLVPALTILIGGGLAVVLILWLRRRLAPGGSRGADLAHALAAHGAARCVAATHLLDALAKREDSAGIAAIWPDLELPLLEALPDCPPDYKIPLINALDACSRACLIVTISRSIMTMRNSMVT